MVREIQARHRARRGATAIEYGLIVALMALVALSGIAAFSDAMMAMYNGDSQSIGGALNSTAP